MADAPRLSWTFPLPRIHTGVPLANAALQMNANYVRADGGRTTMILSVDGYPVSAQAFTAVNPTRTPVKDPGPALTAKMSNCGRARFCSRSNFSNCPKNRREWVSPTSFETTSSS